MSVEAEDEGNFLESSPGSPVYPLKGDVIKEARKMKGYTQEELADKVNVSHGSVYFYENEKHVPRYETVEKILDELDLEVYEAISEDFLENGNGQYPSLKEKLRERRRAEERNEFITPERLAKAMAFEIGNGDGKEDFEDFAERLFRIYGFDQGPEKGILDNTLEKGERWVVYYLEEKGILSSRRKNENIYDGRLWNIDQWYFNRNKILEAWKKYENDGEDEEKSQAQKAYDEVPEEAWKRENN